MLFVSMGLLSMSLFLLIPSDLLYKFDWIFMLISIGLLIALFIPDYNTVVSLRKIAKNILKSFEGNDHFVF